MSSHALGQALAPLPGLVELAEQLREHVEADDHGQLRRGQAQRPGSGGPFVNVLAKAGDAIGDGFGRGGLRQGAL